MKKIHYSLVILILFLISFGTFLYRNSPFLNRSDNNSFLIEKAVLNNDVTLCNSAKAYYEDHDDYGYNFSKEDAIKICKASYYGKIGDFETCLKIPESDFKSHCDYYISWYPKDTDFCERLRSSGFYGADFCYLRLSDIKKDKSFCNFINEQSSYKKDCLSI